MRLISIFFSLFLLYFSAHSQNILQITVGTPFDEMGSLFKTNDGFHIVGYTNMHGSDDMYIVQLNTSLEVNWSKTISSSSGERAMDLVQKPNGNILIAGWGKSGSSTYMFDINPAGDIGNISGFGTIHDRLFKIMATNDGGYLNYGELEGLVPGRNKVSLIKYDSEMKINWKNYYDYSSSSDADTQFEMYARQAIQLKDSSFIILGSYTNIRNASNNRKIRLIKIDKNGNEEWVKGFHGGRMDNAFHMILCNDGGYLLSATSNSYSGSRTKILIIKTNNIGEQEWLRTYGGNDNELAGQVLQLQNGDFMISGSTNSFGSGNNDYLLFKIDDKGEVLKAHTYGGKGDDISIKLDTISKDFILSGNSTSFGSGNKNIYIVKTSFLEASIECSLDVTALLKTNIVNSTFYSDRYSTGIFESPVTNNLSSIFVDSKTMKPCSYCPVGETRFNTLCHNESILINYNDKDIISVKWQDNSDQLVRKLEEEGIYWVDIKTNQCIYRDSIILKNEIDYDLNLGEDMVICSGDTINLVATLPDALGYYWQDGTNTSIYKASKTGIYKVIVETNCGIISDSIQLVSPDNENIFIPNVITPNEDGYNDSFEILGTDFQVQLSVFNRWGKEVYESNSYNNRWTGQNLSSGVYFYLVNIGCTNQDFKGSLQVIK